MGLSGLANFIQTGGTNTVAGEVDLGYSTHGNGTYSLGGTGLLSTTGEDVGDVSTGNFTQTGGTNTINGTLWVGYYSSATGPYSLTSSGRLSATTEYGATTAWGLSRNPAAPIPSAASFSPARAAAEPTTLTADCSLPTQ